MEINLKAPAVRPPITKPVPQRRSLIGRQEILDCLNIGDLKLKHLRADGLPVVKIGKILCSHVDVIDNFIKEKVKGITLPWLRSPVVGQIWKPQRNTALWAILVEQDDLIERILMYKPLALAVLWRHVQDYQCYPPGSALHENAKEFLFPQDQFGKEYLVMWVKIGFFNI